MKIGDLIKYMREYNGITRETLSKSICVKVQQIGSIERSKHLMRFDTLDKVLKFFKMDETSFFYIKNVFDGKRKSNEFFEEENKIIEFIKRRNDQPKVE